MEEIEHRLGATPLPRLPESDSKVPMGASFEGSDDDQTLDAKKRRRVDSGKR